MTTFNDIFKSGFLEKAAAFSLVDVTIAMLISFALGLFILFIYKRTFKGVMYSEGFGLSLIAMTIITTLIILAVTANVVLSLGMVGALSIVRFRTAVKEPMDISFLFWAISVGIVTGAGFIPLAVTGSAFIGVILLVFANYKGVDTPYILMVNCEDAQAETQALTLIQNGTRKNVLRSKSVSQSGIELTMEVRLSDDSSKVMNSLLAESGISNAVLVSYNGDYMA